MIGRPRKYNTPDELQLSKIFHNMKSRCYNHKINGYAYYGGKGVVICDEWLNNVFDFIKWALDNGYQLGLSIDRIDPNKNYFPENCRWVTKSENSRNLQTFLPARRKGVVKPTGLPTENILNTTQSAKLIYNAKTKKPGVSRGRVIRMIRDGLLPADKFGRDWLIRPSDIRKLDGRSDGRPKTK